MRNLSLLIARPVACEGQLHEVTRAGCDLLGEQHVLAAGCVADGSTALRLHHEILLFAVLGVDEDELATGEVFLEAGHKYHQRVMIQLVRLLVVVKLV